LAAVYHDGKVKILPDCREEPTSGRYCRNNGIPLGGVIWFAAPICVLPSVSPQE
jgi:hypothetical protein